MTARRFRVTGHVQGVGFRWGARAEARRLGIRGTVSNTDDGAVEAIAAGGPDALQAFATWLRHGPPGATVDRLETEPVTGHAVDAATADGFTIGR